MQHVEPSTGAIFESPSSTYRAIRPFVHASKLIKCQQSRVKTSRCRVPTLLCMRKYLQESVVPIEYFEAQDAPELQNTLSENDWVSGVEIEDQYILTGKPCSCAVYISGSFR